MEEAKNEALQEENTAKQTSNAPPVIEEVNPTLEKLKLLGVIIIIFAFALYATQSWKGDAGFPARLTYDFPFHAYRMWFTADHLSHLNFDFEWDYKSNTLFARSYPLLPFVVGAPFVMLFGLWQGISYYVLLCYFLLGLGMYFLGKTLKLSGAAALFLGITILLSYLLVLETQNAGALHRLFTYAILPWLLLCFFNKEKGIAQLALAVLLAAVVLSHALTAISIILMLVVFTMHEILQAGKFSIKYNAPFLATIVMAGLLTSPYIGSTLIEQANKELNQPLYLKGSSNSTFGAGEPLPAALFTRNYGFVSGDDGSFKVNGYMGITVIALAIVGIISRKSFWFPITILVCLFYIILTMSEYMPPVLQATHYSRPLFFVSFLLSILAAFGTDKIINSVSIKFKNYSKYATIIITAILITIVFIDLATGVTTFPNLGFAQTSISNFYSTIKGPDRAYASTPYLGYAWASLSSAEFIQYSQEILNPEYYEFIDSYLYRVIPEQMRQNYFYLLGVSTYVRFNLYADVKEFSKIAYNGTRAFKPAKVILINYPSVEESQRMFHSLFDYDGFTSNKFGFLLPRIQNKEKIDYTLVKIKTKPNEVTLQDLPSLFASVPNAKELPWGKDNRDNTHVLVDSPGWVFVSQMWYPHWRVNGKPVQEAGGGLIAFYADKPGEYKIYWERPWYDYVFWAISLATLALLIYLALNPKKYEELLSKIPGN